MYSTVYCFIIIVISYYIIGDDERERGEKGGERKKINRVFYLSFMISYTVYILYYIILY